MTTNPAVDTNVYLDEYSRNDNIARYISETAGAGVAHVLEHVYGPIYSTIIRSLMAESPQKRAFRILEYGCGGGMNLLRIVELLQEQDADLDRAFGTDFSPPMIEAARHEAKEHLRTELNAKISYIVAGNETLARDLALGVGLKPSELHGTFDLIVGVNTFRFAHRLNKENECARDILNLLRPGGYSIMIDMNRRFPLFRSKVRDMLTRPKHQYYIPSLKEYTRPFQEEGFVIKETRNICWIPHSANGLLLSLCRKLTPILDTCFSGLAMRSLVIAQKP